MSLKTSRKSEFPIEECVKNCYLKKVQYKSGVDQNNEPWQAIIFSFSHKDEWTSLFIRNVRRKDFEDDTKFKYKKYQLELAIERILSTYLDSDGMKSFRDGLKSIEITFKSYADYLIETLEKTKYKQISVDLKTIPASNKEARISPYGIFIRRSDNNNTVMQYSEWELDLISNSFNSKNLKQWD